MSDAESPGIAARWRELPRWLRIGAIALLVGALFIAGLVVVRLITGIRVIEPGPRAAADIPAGACLAEEGAKRDEYTVVSCDEPHPQQVFAIAELDVDDAIGAQIAGAIDRFADEVCDRHVEYRLYLAPELEPREYIAEALGAPSPEAFTAGEDEVRCTIRTESGDPLVGDLYRPMP